MNSAINPNNSPEINIDDYYEGVEFPSLLKRVQALLIDVIILLIVFLTTYKLIELIGDAPGWLRASILIFMLYIYEPLLVSSISGTIGHYAMGLRVMNHKRPNRKIGFFVAFFRFLLKGLLGWLSFLTINTNSKKRAIHDLGSGSIVVLKKNIIDK